MARKYLIETFGCQMNVHDSERMAGLLEQAGFEATADAADADVVVINTCSVRERAEEKLYTRLGELRQLAAEEGHDPIVAIAGCVAQQEGRRAPQALARRRRRRDRHAGDSPAPDVGRAGARSEGREVDRAALLDLNPYDDVTFPLGVTRRGDPGQGVRDHHRGLQRILQLLRGAVHARARADAAQGRHPGRGPRGGGQRAAGSAAARPDRQPLRRAGRSGVRLHRASSKPSTRSTASTASGLRARIRVTWTIASSRRCSGCRRCAGTCTCPCSRDRRAVLQSMRRRYTREGYLALVARIRERLPDVALSTDMIVGFPTETAADFEETLALTSSGPVSQHVLVQVFAPSQHAGRAAPGRTR